MSKEELLVQYHLDRDGKIIATPLDENKQPKNFTFVVDEDPRIAARWSLTPQHDLKLTLDGAFEGAPEQNLILSGEILSVDADGISFSFGFQDKEGKTHVRVLKFGGTWAADEQNRLTLKLSQRSSGGGETLVLDGLWEVGENHEIVYQYRRRGLKSGPAAAHKIVFKGEWELSDRDHLSFLVEGDSSQRFRFRAMLTDTRIVAGVGAVQFQVGIDVGAKNIPHVQDVTLFGKWKVGRDFSVTFSIAYEEGRLGGWKFGATKQILSKSEIGFSLRGNGDEPLGIEVVFSKKLLQADGEVYVKLRRSFEETFVEGGVRFLWGAAALLLLLPSPAAAAEEPKLPPVLPPAEAAGPAAPAPDAKKPKLVIPKAEYDFGRVLAGPKVKHVFEVENAGEADLRIFGVTTSCGCTSALLDQPLVAPGGRARIQAVFDTQGRSGPQSKLIMFQTNDPLAPKGELKIGGVVQARLASSPSFIYFSGAASGTDRTVTVTNFTMPRFALEGVGVSSPFLEISTQTPAGTPSAAQAIRISLKKGYPHEKIHETLAVFTNDPLQPVVWIPVWGRRD